MVKRILICPDKCLGLVSVDEYSFSATSISQEQIVIDSSGHWIDTLETETIEWPGEGDDIFCVDCNRPARWIDHERQEGPVAEGQESPAAHRPHPGRRY